MQAELDAKLCEDFPILYKERKLSPYVTCMCGGFPGDGWHKIIRSLSEKLEALNKELPEDSKIVAKQVKEKFGTLRFYIGAVPKEHFKEVYRIISESERQSCTACETCGLPGTIDNSHSWVVTICPACKVKRDVEFERKQKARAIPETSV